MTPAGPARFLELRGALVAHEVVAREDVVDPQAVRAGEALAHVALQKALAVETCVAPAVVEEATSRFPVTSLAGRGLHPPLFTTGAAGGACGLPTGRYNEVFPTAYPPEPLDGASA